MRRASRGRLLVPASWRDVGGKEGFAGAATVDVVDVKVPFTCDAFCVLGCVEDAVGGLALLALPAVVGGVEMPFVSGSAAGEAMLEGRRRGMIWVLEGSSRRAVSGVDDEVEEELSLRWNAVEAWTLLVHARTSWREPSIPTTHGTIGTT